MRQNSFDCAFNHRVWSRGVMRCLYRGCNQCTAANLTLRYPLWITVMRGSRKFHEFTVSMTNFGALRAPRANNEARVYSSTFLLQHHASKRGRRLGRRSSGRFRCCSGSRCGALRSGLRRLGSHGSNVHHASHRADALATCATTGVKPCCWVALLLPPPAAPAPPPLDAGSEDRNASRMNTGELSHDEEWEREPPLASGSGRDLLDLSFLPAWICESRSALPRGAWEYITCTHAHMSPQSTAQG